VRQRTAPTVSFGAFVDDAVAPHTLILGTHPSEISFTKAQYFANPANAFWWIVGDALGFRRDAGLNTSGKPAGRTDYFSELRHETPLLEYEAGIQKLTSSGFALWDVLKSCKRKGSLDADIESGSDVPNDVRGFCAAHPTVRQICLGSGNKTAKYFVKHNQDWIKSGAFRLSAGEPVPAALADALEKPRVLAKKWRAGLADGADGARGAERLTLAVMASVSPAAAGISYAEKRASWERLCFEPGLRDLAARRATKSRYF
jgi:hypoxanthine-DNA glycosylase